MSDIQNQLKEFLKTAETWERMETPIPGIYMIKLPPTKKRSAILNMELNPIKNDGNRTKKKGLFVSGGGMLLDFCKLFQDERVHKLLNDMESVNESILEIKESKKLEM